MSLHVEKRNNADWLQAVLHDNFLEISRSGYIYTKKIVLDTLTLEIKTTSNIFAKNFSMSILNTNTALLTYHSYEMDRTDTPFNQALRSSIWQLSSCGKWQLRFHQGTLLME
ncbi:nuclear transport factor 2 family protein [Xenorhabdus sp. M]|uniref:Nuclear transport factor 2 family protein n=1 Tax=Xenorhabdus szentirmaii TaxID=290112 RepID=A0AAW3YRP7_9GAMM|nr:nuclear transport factor 2 family protein [Xenorhabdus sp. M]